MLIKHVYGPSHYDALKNVFHSEYVGDAGEWVVFQRDTGEILYRFKKELITQGDFFGPGPVNVVLSANGRTIALTVADNIIATKSSWVNYIDAPGYTKAIDYTYFSILLVIDLETGLTKGELREGPVVKTSATGSFLHLTDAVELPVLSSKGDFLARFVGNELQIFRAEGMQQQVRLPDYKGGKWEIGEFSKDQTKLVLYERASDDGQNGQLQVLDTRSGKSIYEYACRCSSPKFGGKNDEFIAGIAGNSEITLIKWRD